jgi:WD40 repeat protein
VGEGATKGEYSIIAGRINDIAWDGDSQRIIAVGDGRERFGHCITADSGNSCGEVSGNSAQINAVSIRQQRPIRAATASDDTSMVFYHGVPFKFNTKLQDQHNKYIYGTSFNPDGSSLVSVGSDKRIWLYDGKTGEPQKQIGEGEHTGMSCRCRNQFGADLLTLSRQHLWCFMGEGLETPRHSQC